MSTMTATQKGQLHLYIKYSSKPPNLPEAVAESAEELSEMTGMTKGSIYSGINHGKRTVAKVVVEEEE